MKRQADKSCQKITVRAHGPFDLQLSLAGADSFFPIQRPTTALETAVDVDGASVVITVWQPRAHSSIQASTTSNVDQLLLRRIAKWLVSSDLDLRPFYRLVRGHPIMGPVASSLDGLKPLRPATLFEMAVIAITEQQLSLAAAFHIRRRLVQRLGKSIEPSGVSRCRTNWQEPPCAPSRVAACLGARPATFRNSPRGLPTSH